MSGILPRFAGLALPLAAVAIAGAAVAPRLAGEPESPPTQSERAMPVSVFTAEMQPDYEIRRGFTGRVTARQRADLGFERAGRVAAVSVDTGASVAKGDTLARLDTAELQTRRRELEAARREAEAELTLARKTQARNQRLFKQDHISQQRLDETVAERDAAQARLARLKAEIDSIDVELENAKLVAPFAGVIERRLVDEGTVVESGTPILRLIETRVLEAEIGLPLDFARRLERGDHMPLRTENEALIFAQVKSVVPAVRGETRTALVTAAITGEVTDLIADGSLVTATMRDTVQSRGFWAPLRALTADVRGLWRVYTVRESGDGTQRVGVENVQILYSEDERVFVSGTVDDGDRLIAGGVDRVVPGQRVRVEDTTAAPGSRGES